MVTTVKQDSDFGSKFLGDIADHIAENFSPDEVFQETDLKTWAQKKEPDDIFTATELGNWAEANGYTKY